MTPYDVLPSDLIAELTDAGLDPAAIYEEITEALEEDLPGGADDATSAATIPADAHGVADFAGHFDTVMSDGATTTTFSPAPATDGAAG